MAISQNRTFRWALEPYTASQDYANDALDMTWSEYVKGLLEWEQRTGAYADWLNSQRQTPETAKSQG